MLTQQPLFQEDADFYGEETVQPEALLQLWPEGLDCPNLIVLDINYGGFFAGNSGMLDGEVETLEDEWIQSWTSSIPSLEHYYLQHIYDEELEDSNSDSIWEWSKLDW